MSVGGGAVPVAGVQGVGLCPFGRLFFEVLQVRVELALVDPPHAAAPDLDGGEFAGANQRVDLGNADAQIRGPSSSLR